MIELNRILCPIDFSPFSEHALDYAVKIAKWSGARVRVLHVMPPLPESSSSALAEAGRALTERNLRSAIARHRHTDLAMDTQLVESSDVAQKILECADAFDADVIITGSHGRTGVQRALLGSVVEPLLHKTGRAVLTIPSHVDITQLDGAPQFGRIVCAVDFAKASLEAAAVAFSLAEESNARLTLLHVIEQPPELSHVPSGDYSTYDVGEIRAEAEAAVLTRLRALVPEHALEYCTVETSVLEGGVARQILRMASTIDADLIVLGVHGRNAFDLAFFGSNSKEIIRESHCPVLIVPASRRLALKAVS